MSDENDSLTDWFGDDEEIDEDNEEFVYLIPQNKILHDFKTAKTNKNKTKKR